MTIENIKTLLSGYSSEMPFGGGRGGMLYQDFPWQPLAELPAYRHSTANRVNAITGAVDVRDKTVADVGCANGAIAIGIAKAGARSVIGYDANPVEIKVAKEASLALGIPNVRFKIFEVMKNPATVLGACDVMIYLSVWKWIAFRHGITAAIDTLAELSDQCNVMIFESGLTGTGVDLVDFKREDVLPMLSKHTNFVKFESRMFDRDDMNVDREMFICTRHRHFKKIFRWDLKWQLTREILFYERLENVPGVLDVIAFGKMKDGTAYIIFPLCVPILKALKSNMTTLAIITGQLRETIAAIKEHGVVHRDITIDNIVWNPETRRACLIDFGWSRFDHEKDSPIPVPGVMRAWMVDTPPDKQLEKTLLELGRLK